MFVVDKHIFDFGLTKSLRMKKFKNQLFLQIHNLNEINEWAQHKGEFKQKVVVFHKVNI